MDRRTFITNSLCTALGAGFSQSRLTLAAQTTTPTRTASPVPANLADDVYQIYSQLLSAQLSRLHNSNRLCLVAYQTTEPPIPTVSETVPPGFSQRMHSIIVPSPSRWYDFQEVLADLHKSRSEAPFQLKERFVLSALAQPSLPQTVLLLDTYMQQQFLQSFTVDYVDKLPDGTYVETQHRDAAVLKRLAGCDDLFRLSPVFFNHAADLALVYLHYLEQTCNGGIWGIYAKSSSGWTMQGSEQGWLIVQPSAEEY